MNKKCKYHLGCERYPDFGLQGFCYLHADEDLIEKRDLKRKETIKKSNARKREKGIVRKLATKTVFRKVENRKPLPKVSKKKYAQLKIYAILRKDFLKDRLVCEAMLLGCKKEAVDVHHLYSGRDRSAHFTEIETWKAVCRNCHNRIHRELSTEQLIELGLRKID